MSPASTPPWMPELCRLPRLAAMLGLAELVVVVLALAPDGSRHWTFGELLSASGFALWLALAVTASLCLLRQTLSRLPPVLGAIAATVLATLIAVVCAGIVHALYAVLGDSFASGISFWRFTLGSAATTALIAALALRYFYVSDRWAAQVQANARAQADALQARIRPHFLFNSMNLIASLLHRDPAVAERAVLDLSDLFRAALGRARAIPPFATNASWPSATCRSNRCAWVNACRCVGSATSRCHGTCPAKAGTAAAGGKCRAAWHLAPARRRHHRTAAGARGQ